MAATWRVSSVAARQLPVRLCGSQTFLPMMLYVDFSGLAPWRGDRNAAVLALMVQCLSCLPFLLIPSPSPPPRDWECTLKSLGASACFLVNFPLTHPSTVFITDGVIFIPLLSVFCQSEGIP